MKVLLSWLRDFAPFEGDPVALGEEMSDLGMAVEELVTIGEGLDGIVVAKVLETRPIEGANKIHLVVVDAGDGQPLEVGCGAFNMAPGDLVPLATVGTVMPSGTADAVAHAGPIHDDTLVYRVEFHVVGDPGSRAW